MSGDVFSSSTKSYIGWKTVQRSPSPALSTASRQTLLDLLEPRNPVRTPFKRVRPAFASVDFTPPSGPTRLGCARSASSSTLLVASSIYEWASTDAAPLFPVSLLYVAQQLPCFVRAGSTSRVMSDHEIIIDSEDERVQRRSISRSRSTGASELLAGKSKAVARTAVKKTQVIEVGSSSDVEEAVSVAKVSGYFVRPASVASNSAPDAVSSFWGAPVAYTKAEKDDALKVSRPSARARSPPIERSVSSTSTASTSSKRKADPTVLADKPPKRPSIGSLAEDDDDLPLASSPASLVMSDPPQPTEMLDPQAFVRAAAGLPALVRPSTATIEAAKPKRRGKGKGKVQAVSEDEEASTESEDARAKIASFSLGASRSSEEEPISTTVAKPKSKPLPRKKPELAKALDISFALPDKRKVNALEACPLCGEHDFAPSQAYATRSKHLRNCAGADKNDYTPKTVAVLIDQYILRLADERDKEHRLAELDHTLLETVIGRGKGPTHRRLVTVVGVEVEGDSGYGQLDPGRLGAAQEEIDKLKVKRHIGQERLQTAAKLIKEEALALKLQSQQVQDLAAMEVHLATQAGPRPTGLLQGVSAETSKLMTVRANAFLRAAGGTGLTQMTQVLARPRVSTTGALTSANTAAEDSDIELLPSTQTFPASKVASKYVGRGQGVARAHKSSEDHSDVSLWDAAAGENDDLLEKIVVSFLSSLLGGLCPGLHIDRVARC